MKVIIIMIQLLFPREIDRVKFQVNFFGATSLSNELVAKHLNLNNFQKEKLRLIQDQEMKRLNKILSVARFASSNEEQVFIFKFWKNNKYMMEVAEHTK